MIRPMYPLKRPKAETVQVCIVCGQPWEHHMELAFWRLSMAKDDLDELGTPTEEETEEAVSWAECIRLLQAANQGPPGPPGPVGMSGPPGAPGRSA